MGQGHHHGERAFEAFLRARRTPYVSVNEARRTLVPSEGTGAGNLKNFDFVAYTTAKGGRANLLVDIKCRQLPACRTNLRLVGADGITRPVTHSRSPYPRLENWATREDIRSLKAWQELFGPGFKAAFVFVYWCETGNPNGKNGSSATGLNQPPDGLFDEVFLQDGRWYAIRGLLIDDYEPAMKDRSTRWQTVDIPPSQFERLSSDFGRTWLGDGKADRTHLPLSAARAAGR